MKHFLCAVLLLTTLLGGCGGTSSNPTSTNGPVSGTVAPFTPVSPATPTSDETGKPVTASPASTPAIPASALSSSARFPVQLKLDAPAPYTIAAKDYNFGTVAVSSDNGTVFLARIHGGLWFPEKPVSANDTLPPKYPVVVLMHGQHAPFVPSYQGYEYIARDLAAHGVLALSIDANDINAHGIYDGDPSSVGDPSSQSRGQLVLATLDKLTQINAYGTVEGSLNVLIGKIDLDHLGIMGHSRGGQGIDSAIKLNAQRVGVSLTALRGAEATLQSERDTDLQYIWEPATDTGHGSSAQFKAQLNTIADAVANKTLSDSDLQKVLDSNNVALAAGPVTSPVGPNTAPAAIAPPYTFRAALALAPTDNRNFTYFSNVTFAGMVGTCDGDVRNLDGAHVFDSNRFVQGSTDASSRFQIAVRGANHNYFNTIWTGDDYVGYFQTYCAAQHPDTTDARLNRDDQKSLGLFLISGFMRYFVNGETQFAPYWNSTARIPASFCPAGQTSCDNRVLLTLQTNGQTNGVSNHRLIAPFDDNYQLNQPYDATTALLHQGGPLDLIDASAFGKGIYTCSQQFQFFSAFRGVQSIPCTPRSPFFTADVDTYSGGLISAPNQLQLIVPAPAKPGADAALSITLKEPGVGATTLASDLLTRGYDTLTFRIAVVDPVAQELTVTLTDSNGVVSAPIDAKDFSDALDGSMGLPVRDGSKLATLLNMVAIPLDAFKAADAGAKFDVSRVKELRLTFPSVPAGGSKVALTDFELQNFARAMIDR
jgi:hypothetical protein